MRVKLKKLYYCDFCKKHSLRSLAKHEIVCTMNPNRECHLCKEKVDLPNIVTNIKSNILINKNEEGLILNIKHPSLEDIKKLLKYNCPNCILAIIRQSRLNKYPLNIEFDYRKELKEWWSNNNEEERKRDELSTIY